MTRSIIILPVLLSLVCAGCEFGGKNEEAPVAPSAAPAGRAQSSDWGRIKPVEPSKEAEGLTLLLRAESVTGLPSGAPVRKWLDESANALALLKAAGPAPVWIQSAVHGKAAIRFSGKDQQLSVASVPGSKLFSADAAALFVVMMQDSSWPNDDLFGWGGCGDNRFNTHFASNSGLVFQDGNPGSFNFVVAKPAGWDNAYHVVAVQRDGKNAHMTVDGKVVGATTQFSQGLKVDLSKPLVIGGMCNNGFKGDISEIVLFKKTLGEAQERGTVKYLADKYKIQLN